MLASELIHDAIPPLKTSDTIQRALDRMAEFRVSHLPIVNESELLGLISDQDVIEIYDHQEPVGNQQLSLLNAYVYDYQHVYDVLKAVYDQQLTLIPLIDRNKAYLGAITLQKLAYYCSKITSSSQPGGIIVLEVTERNYTLTEVVKIIESNQALLLSFYLEQVTDSTKLYITLKLNKTDITGVLSSFERFGYTVKASFQDAYLDQTMDRFESFMNYLNM